MKKFREFLSKPTVTAVLFALALLLLGSSTVAGARAALNIQSEYYNSEVEVLDIGVVLVEKQSDDSFKTVVGKNSLMGATSPIAEQIKQDTKLLPGKLYPEVLAVRNNAEINEYVRVSVFKYWLDKQGEKTSVMNSDWIELGFVTGKGWTQDDSEGSNTEERTILYYKDYLKPGEQTTPFLESVKINDKILTLVSQESHVEGDVTVTTTTFLYNDYQFCIEVLVDGVQDHNADQAKLSAWGVNK